MTMLADQERATRPETRSSDLANAIATCFERLLRCGPVDPDDGFFELGGDSLLAVSLLIELEKLTGQELPLSALYECSTVRALTAALSSRAPVFNPVVAFRSGTVSPPLFLVHGIFGGLGDLLEIAACLPTERAVYGLQPRGLDGAADPFERVEDMAAYYLDAIRKHQPHGPYLLVGYSFGGLVALEMARQLRAVGERIGSLCLIDTYPSPRHWSWPSLLATRFRRGRSWLRAIVARPGETLPRFWHQLSHPSHRGLEGAANAESERGVALSDAMRRVRTANYHAFMRYTPVPCEGSVTFLRASKPRQFPADPQAVWRASGIALTLHTLSGDHYSMIRENKRLLADRLLSCVEQDMVAGDPTPPP